MSDNISKEVRKKTMQAVKSNRTKLEDIVIKELRTQGLRFRRNVKDLPGKPDLAIKKYKIAVFIDSCFWHGCQQHCRIPQSNVEYWKNKIERNINRDKEINLIYLNLTWNIIRIWEHDIKNDFNFVINNIVDAVNRSKNII
ncbi:MAG: very short patch repair endonuclease [Bacillota bacterium]|nr:very short patch repair endonuclease [Bacillota bacterium]